MECRWVPIGLAVTAMATCSVPARADTPEAKNEPAQLLVASDGQSRLEIVVPVESDVDGLEIQCDGVLIPASSYGVAIAVDAGTHALVAQAPGRRPWSTQLRLAPGQMTVTVTIPRLGAELAVAPPPAERASATATPAGRIERDTGKTERTIGYVLGGVGLTSLALGAWLGFDAVSMQRDLRAQCPRGQCPPEARGSLDQIRTEAGAANSLMVLGLASSIGAAIFFLVAPSAPAPERSNAAFHVAPVIAPGGASVVASGKF